MLYTNARTASDGAHAKEILGPHPGLGLPFFHTCFSHQCVHALIPDVLLLKSFCSARKPKASLAFALTLAFSLKLPQLH